MKEIRKYILKNDGFSLVEVAIALIVIGVILGGVLKGRQLIENARMNVLMRNVDMYRVAFHLFQETYGALPGDFHLASDQIDGCLRNGNNDGIISGQGLNPQDEAGQAWRHLSSAHLISDVGALPQFGHAGRGKGVPHEKIGGVMTVRYAPDVNMPGHWLLLGQENGAEGDGALLTPRQAQTICQKMDSIDPMCGRVQGRHGANVAPEDCIKNGRFNTQNDHPACVLYFQL